jgi:ketosteroid isomerase-like protein
VRMVRIYAAVALMFVACSPLYAQQSTQEQAVWKLEHSYWQDVQAADLVRYRALWHQNFIGWAFVSAHPQRKDHITDWLTAYTTKGFHLKSYTIDPAGSQATGNLVVTYYRLNADWVAKDGRDMRETSRITHTWIRTGNGWQIVGGMSCISPSNKK